MGFSGTAASGEICFSFHPLDHSAFSPVIAVFLFETAESLFLWVEAADIQLDFLWERPALAADYWQSVFSCGPGLFQSGQEIS